MKKLFIAIMTLTVFVSCENTDVKPAPATGNINAEIKHVGPQVLEGETMDAEPRVIKPTVAFERVDNKIDD